MRAVLRHDRITSAIYFKVNDIHIIYSIPERLTKIKELIDYDSGTLIMDTNYGEEYTDLIETVEQGYFDRGYKDKFIKYLESLKLSDIELKGC